MSNAFDLDACKSYATEANLDKALAKLGLDAYGFEGEMPCRYIKCRNAEGRWTAIFMVQQYLSMNRTGGYIAFAAQHGFMSV
jgi:hypothetical protein